MSRSRRILQSVVTDIEPLRHSADFRRLWLGTSVSQLGQQMTAVAVAYQVWTITESSFAVGMVGAAAVGPMIVCGLYGGALVDSFDRRRVALLTSSGLWLMSIVLVVQAALGLANLWLLYAVVGVQAGFFAVNDPARRAIMPRLLEARMLPAANALSVLSFNLGFTVGPLAAGAVLATGDGFVLPYAVDAVTFLGALYALWRLPPVPPTGTVRRAGLAAVAEGLRFLRRRTTILMTFLVDLAAMVLAQPRSLFPEYADHVYRDGPRALGVLQAAPAVGAVLAGLTSGWLHRVRRQGAAILVCVVVYGASIAAFGLAGSLWLGVVFLAASGAADMISSAYRMTILQVAAPDEMRGRLQGVFIVVVAGGPRLGEMAAGSAAALVGPTLAVVGGGCACMVATAVLAARFRGFARYDATDPHPHAAP